MCEYDVGLTQRFWDRYHSSDNDVMFHFILYIYVYHMVMNGEEIPRIAPIFTAIATG